LQVTSQEHDVEHEIAFVHKLDPVHAMEHGPTPQDSVPWHVFMPEHSTVHAAALPQLTGPPHTPVPLQVT
jgi:hypothetical protein